MKSRKIIILFVCKQQRWRNVFQSGGAQVHVKKSWKFFFIKQVALTIDPILIVLLKPTVFEQNSKFKSSAY